MTPKLADYIEAGKAFDAGERLEAAHQLLLSVDRDAGVEQVDIDAAWDETIDRRVGEIVSGTASQEQTGSKQTRVPVYMPAAPMMVKYVLVGFVAPMTPIAVYAPQTGPPLSP